VFGGASEVWGGGGVRSKKQAVQAKNLCTD